MNLKNLIMWAIIVLLSVGLFNMFQDPEKINLEKIFQQKLRLPSRENQQTLGLEIFI